MIVLQLHQQRAIAIPSHLARHRLCGQLSVYTKLRSRAIRRCKIILGLSCCSCVLAARSVMLRCRFFCSFMLSDYWLFSGLMLTNMKGDPVLAFKSPYRGVS